MNEDPTPRAYLVGPDGRAHDKGRIFLTGITPEDAEADARDLYLSYESTGLSAGPPGTPPQRHTILMRINGATRDLLWEQLEQADQVAAIRATEARADRERRRRHGPSRFRLSYIASLFRKRSPT